jgi:hypothetical protein
LLLPHSNAKLVDLRVQLAAPERNLAFLLCRHLVREACEAVVQLPPQRRNLALLLLELLEQLFGIVVGNRNESFLPDAASGVAPSSRSLQRRQ